MAFTAKLNALGQFELPSTVEMKLRDDMVKVLESAAGDQFVATEFVGVNVGTASTAITTDGTATATATANLTGANVRDYVSFLKKKDVPAYDGQNYICIASVEALKGMHDDTGTGGWQEISKHTANRAEAIFNGEVGNFFKTRFVEETGYLSNTIGDSSAYGAAVFFGADSVYEAMSIPEEIRVKNPQDYGRDQGLAWYSLLGFQIVWDFAVDSEQHILYVTSA